jgi:hypothetical protein
MTMEYLVSSAQADIYKDGTKAIKSGFVGLHKAYSYCCLACFFICKKSENVNFEDPSTVYNIMSKIVDKINKSGRGWV